MYYNMFDNNTWSGYMSKKAQSFVDSWSSTTTKKKKKQKQQNAQRNSKRWKYAVDDVVLCLEDKTVGVITDAYIGQLDLPYYTVSGFGAAPKNVCETDIIGIDELPTTPITSDRVTEHVTTPNRNMDLDEYDSWESIKNTQTLVDTLQERADATTSDIDSLTERILSCEDSITAIQNRDYTDCGTINDCRVADIEERVVDIEQKQKKSSKLAKLAILSRLL